MQLYCGRPANVTRTLLVNSNREAPICKGLACGTESTINLERQGPEPLRYQVRNQHKVCAHFYLGTGWPFHGEGLQGVALLVQGESDVKKTR